MENQEIAQKAFEETITAMHNAFQEELFNCKEADLEKYWHFKYNKDRPLVYNQYEFCSMLELYRGFCRRWEEHTNGTCCVVERVRDKYLMPKIREFVNEIETNNKSMHKL